MTLDAWEAALREGAAALGIALTEPAVAAWRQHCELLAAYSARAGLTAISDPAEVAIKHVLDSLSGLLVRDIRPGEQVADVGPGGGFPGLVLAAARPQARYTLIEANRRRAAFLAQAARELGLSQVTVVAARAEEAGQDPRHREQYHLVVSRAVAPLPVLLELCLPLARVGGQALAYKGPEAEVEVTRSAAALAALGGRVAEAMPLALPRGMGERRLVLVAKERPTPAQYPRRPGTPAKRPLCPRDTRG